MIIAHLLSFGKLKAKMYNLVMSARSLMISPSILGGNFSNTADDIAAIAASGADYAHFDVMDGHFVPEITFGAKMIEDARPLTDLIFDVHLMIEKPELSVERFAKAGAGIITVHAEATRHIWRTLTLIKECGAEAGVAINPGTPVSFIESVLPIADYILVMTVNPGWSGQRFIPECMDKIAELDQRRHDDGYGYLIEADGGIGLGNVKALFDAGMDMAVVGSAFFREDDKATFVSQMQERCL